METTEGKKFSHQNILAVPLLRTAAFSSSISESVLNLAVVVVFILQSYFDVSWWLRCHGFNVESLVLCVGCHSVQVHGICEAGVKCQEDTLSFSPNYSLVICMEVPKRLNKSLGKFPAEFFLLEPVI